MFQVAFKLWHSSLEFQMGGLRICYGVRCEINFSNYINDLTSLISAFLYKLNKSLKFKIFVIKTASSLVNLSSFNQNFVNKKDARYILIRNKPKWHWFSYKYCICSNKRTPNILLSRWVSSFNFTISSFCEWGELIQNWFGTEGFILVDTQQSSAEYD